MKKQVTIHAEPRARTGKGAARQLRREGYLPAVVYGHGDDSRALKVKTEEMERLLARIHVATTVVDLEVDGESRQVLIREIQRHPYRPDLLHVDFFHIRADEKIRIEVPLRLAGKSIGVEEGGVLQQSRHEIAIECLPHDIPEEFTIDVSGLEIGDTLHVGDIDTGAVEVLDDPDLTICSVVAPTVVQVEEPEVVELVEGLELEPAAEGVEVEPEAEEEPGEAEEERDEG